MGENREKDGDDQGGPGSEAGPDPADDGDYDDESKPGAPADCTASSGGSIPACTVFSEGGLSMSVRVTQKKQPYENIGRNCEPV